MLRARTAVVSIAIAAALGLSCGSKSPNDQSIVTDIQSKLYADATTKPAAIAVTAQNGVVTLSGDVPSGQVAQEAVRIANGTSGVRTVNNQMTVNGALAAPQVNNPGSPANPSGSPIASNTPPSNPPPSAPPPPQRITFPAGEHLQVQTIDPINSRTDNAGQTFRASLASPLVHRGRVIVPVGAPVALVVTAARSAGRIRGKSQLEVRASAIDVHGHRYPLDTSLFEEQGKARGRQTAVRTGIGAVAGAVIGGLAGGGKGAAIGSAAGGGAGFGTDLFTRGQQVKIPSETRIIFRLEAPLKLERR